MLRPATTADVPDVLDAQSWPEVRDHIGSSGPEELEQMTTGGPTGLFVWEKDRAITGFAILDKLDEQGRVFLRRLALKAPGKGEGQALIRAVLTTTFVTHKANRLWLIVMTGNARAITAYEKAGFTNEGTLRQHYTHHLTGCHDMYVYGMLATDPAAPKG